MLALSVAEIAELSNLLDQAMPMDLPARRAWLDQLPERHHKLTDALRRSLLEEPGDGTVGARFETLPRIAEAACGLAVARARLEPGARVGPYRLLCQIGAGGMAEVWHAQRDDGAFRREVALKIPMFSERRPDLGDRFARECDILAGLEHVNIARMYDAGTTAEGLPYMAMEYVRGDTLVDWCDARRLGTPERVELFLQVLDAMQYAHARRVVHRDLKPANILVDGDGQVRLLDFGVARVAGGDETRDMAITRVYGRALTPDYASPELLRGECADARSDIYSLGVVLYELLTGSRPYRMKTGASATGLRRALDEARIDPPGTGLPLGRDLDRIVLKALTRAAGGRYESVAAMSDDLQRYLARVNGEPLSRRPFARPAGATTSRPAARRFRQCAAALALAALCALALWAFVAGLPPLRGPAAPSAGQAVAVLPFADLSEGGGQDVFAEGVADQIRIALAQARALPVSGRTSSTYFKGRPSTIAEIARDLGVAYVLEGSVRASGRHLRVSAELVRADNGFVVWSATLDREAGEALQAQDEIARIVSAGVRSALPAASG